MSVPCAMIVRRATCSPAEPSAERSTILIGPLVTIPRAGLRTAASSPLAASGTLCPSLAGDRSLSDPASARDCKTTHEGTARVEGLSPARGGHCRHGDERPHPSLALGGQASSRNPLGTSSRNASMPISPASEAKDRARSARAWATNFLKVKNGLRQIRAAAL
jgi:hypothetical protein